MRILILAPRSPWPATDGGRIAMARLAGSLGRQGAVVRVLSLNPRKHRVADIAAPLPLELVDADTSRIVRPAIEALASRAPFLVTRFVSRELRLSLRRVLSEWNPDIVQIESPFLLPYVDEIRAHSKARVVLRSLNVEFRIWQLLADEERNLAKRFFLRRIAESLRRYETRSLDVPDAIVPISRDDLDEFRRLGATRPMHVAPCGMKAAEVRDDVSVYMTVGFIGSLDFRPNQQAVQWILDELWPRVVARVPEARLSIAGSSPPVWLRERVFASSIDFLGFVDDPQSFLRRMSVVIAPLFAGGGMRIKVLEAMALGRPVVATALGAGGIDVEHERDILIAEETEAFATQVVRLLADAELRARLGAAARQTVAERYDDDRIAKGLIDFYRSL
jgi:glycosyltransferase involved in cell wall biosynthesis